MLVISASCTDVFKSCLLIILTKALHEIYVNSPWTVGMIFCRLSQFRAAKAPLSFACVTVQNPPGMVTLHSDQCLPQNRECTLPALSNISCVTTRNAQHLKTPNACQDTTKQHSSYWSKAFAAQQTSTLPEGCNIQYVYHPFHLTHRQSIACNF